MSGALGEGEVFGAGRALRPSRRSSIPRIDAAARRRLGALSAALPLRWLEMTFRSTKDVSSGRGGSGDTEAERAADLGEHGRLQQPPDDAEVRQYAGKGEDSYHERQRQHWIEADRPGPVSAINVVRRRMPAVALTAGRARRAAAGLCEPRRAHPRTVAALPYRPG
jgi:hypothetical protein